MVVPLEAGVVRGVKAEEEELLRQREAAEEVGEGESRRRGELVEDDGEGGVGEEGERDGGVLEVVEVVGGDGAVGGEGVVAVGHDEELHRDGGEGGEDDEVEL